MIVIIIVVPLIKLLKIVDGDERPSLAYVYDDMFTAKKVIKSTIMNANLCTNLIQGLSSKDGINTFVKNCILLHMY